MSTALPVVKEDKVYKRYLTVYSRTVRFPDGRDVDWDVVGHLQPNPVFVVIFPFSTTTGTTTLVREYSQGPNEFKYTLAAGQFERKKHTSALDAAQRELAEEARLSAGTWISLIPDDGSHDGVSELKWSTNKFHPWLCLDPVRDTEGAFAERDQDELFSEVKDVGMEELKKLILSGQVMLPSVQTILMAQEYLKVQGLIPTTIL